MVRREFMKAAGAGAAALWAGQSLAQPAPEKTTTMKILLWCWDTRMTWDDQPEAILRAMAAAEKPFPYPKKPEAYLIGFKRLLDYCAQAGIQGIIIWGFLRDSHGGVKAAQDLCKYASDKGVAILPGVGLCSYGGYFFEGEHPFNLGTYLKQHPERISTAVEEGGKRQVTPVLDPSLEANRAWWREGLEWMLDTFEIGGMDFEMGDFVVNPSPEATAARAALGMDADGNILDTVLATRDLMTRANQLRPKGIFINCTYRGYQQIKNFPRMDYLKGFPQETVWEYTLSGMIRQKAFPEGYVGAPDHRKYGYLHWFNASTKTADKDFTPDIARVFPGLHKLNFEFVGTYGELSAQNNPLADRNYRAQVAWAKDAGLAASDFK